MVGEGKERVSVDFSNTRKKRRDDEVVMMMRLKVAGFGVGLVDLTWSP